MRTYTISEFGLREATECSTALRKIGRTCRSMEEVAGKIAELFYNDFVDEPGPTRNFALVRLFKTHAFGKLDAKLKQFARSCFPDQPVYDTTKCLTLLGTIGDNENWRSRENSKEHKAIPLSSEDVVNKLPMIRNLIKHLGLDVQTVIRPDPGLIQNMSEKTYNVFLVPHASGSPYIPAQHEFVSLFAVKSVLGYGGVFPDGEIFVVIIFSRIAISDEVAALFKTIALSVKIALLPFVGKTFS